MFEVLILKSNPNDQVNKIFEGQSSSVTLPGVEGEFEILDFHKPIISQLKNGVILVDNHKEISIGGGIAKMKRQRLVAIVDS